MSAAPKLALAARIRNILFATDFSTCSEGALPVARALAARYGATLHLAHVLPPEAHLEVSLDARVELDTQLEHAEELMADLMLRQPLRGINHEITIEHGPLWHVLQELIHEKNIDLLVLGTSGRRGLKKLMLGSVAEEVFRRAICPVLTVGPHLVHDGLEAGSIRSVLYATDFSSGSMQALAYALSLARENRSRLLLLHVLPHLLEAPPVEVERITESCRQQLLSLVAPGIGLAGPPEPVVLFGAAAENILRLAEEEHAGLIVMGARQPALGMASTHLPWATAHQVVCEARCPVLTVKR